MRGPSPLALLLACLVVLAGCNGLATGGDDPSMPSVTPADVPADLHGGSIAPGLTRQEVVDASALLAAHRDLTANASVTLVDTSREVTENGTLLQGYETTTRYGANRSRFVTQAHLTGIQQGSGETLERYDAWSNGSVTVIRRVIDGTPEYRRAPGSAGAVTDYRIRHLQELLSEFSVTSVRELGERAGHDAYAVSGTTPAGDGDDRQVRLVVDDRGLVREFRTEVTRPEYRDRGTNVTVVRTTRYEAVGTTTVERPDWLAAALAEFAAREYVAPGVTTERVVDGNELRAAHEAALRGTSVTRRQVDRRKRSDGTVSEETTGTLRVAADRSHYRYRRVRVDGDDEWRSEEWSNGTVGYERSVHGDETRYDRYPGGRDRRPHVSFVDVERRGETRVSALVDGRYRVVVDAFEDPNAVVHYGEERTVRDLRVAFVVRESGLVERYELTYTYSEGAENRTFRLNRTTAFTDVGTTTVERPDWLAAAANATGRRHG